MRLTEKELRENYIKELKWTNYSSISFVIIFSMVIMCSGIYLDGLLKFFSLLFLPLIILLVKSIYKNKKLIGENK